MSQHPSPVRLSWRIAVTLYESDPAFERLAQFLVDYRHIVDEVALFESITHHLYIPLDDLAERAAIIAHRIQALRDAGVQSVGINVLTTIGHINEAWDWMEKLPFQPMIGHDGEPSLGCACPNTPQMRSYVREKYRLMAEARPDFIWVDDDIRMHHHGVDYGCFCPTCLDIFSGTTGRSWTREGLVAALDSPEGGAVREAWVEQNAHTLESLMSDVRAAIDEVNPKIVKGLMPAGPSWGGYSGNTWDRWFAALGAVKCRPGGGFYSDKRPTDMIGKTQECGRMRSLVGAEVSDVQYELEDFPYGALEKSAATVINECGLALAAGLNGIAFNALGFSAGPSLEEHRPLMEEVKAARRYWEQYAAHVEGLPSAGVWPVWHPSLWAKRTVAPGESWFDQGREYDQKALYVLAEIGIPLAIEAPTFGPESAVILSGRIAEAFTDDELRAMLSGGVLMDTTALEALERRGLGGLTGVRLSRRYDNGLVERLTDDELNGHYADDIRDCRIEFWGDARGLADEIEPVAPGVRVLSTLEDYRGGAHGAASTAWENELGGRVVVMGYAPWMFVGSVLKRAQLQEICDWISRGRLTVRIEEPVRIAPLVRMDGARGRGAVMLLNAGFDRVREATVHVRSEAFVEGQTGGSAMPPVSILRPNGRVKEATPKASPGGFKVKIVDVEPWTTVCLLFG